MTEEENTVSEEDIADSDIADDAPPETGEREENNAEEDRNLKVKEAEKVSKKPVRYHAPLYIAGCILMAAVLIFGISACFFNTDIEGTWGIEVPTSEENQTMKFNLNFDDNTVRLQSGGTVTIGRFSIAEENGGRLVDEDGNSLLMLYLNVDGNPLVYKFNYQFEGNLFTGRTLKLTDLTGMFLMPDTKDSSEEDVKRHKKITESEKRGDTTYYVWSFRPSTEVYKTEKTENFKADSKLIGTWLYKTEDEAYPYTFTFTKDGKFEQYSYEQEIHGTYTVKDGVCVINYYGTSDVERQIELSYTVKDKKLTLSQDYGDYGTIERELTKTNDKYAFKSETKQ